MENLPKTMVSQVRNKLELVSNKLKELEIKKENGPKTNGLFSWNGREGVTENSGTVNIHKVMSVSLLISILGFLMSKAAEYTVAAEELNLTTFPVFTWSGYNLDAWKNDIDVRISIISHESEVNKLKKVKEELSKYISEEDKVQALLDSIEV